MLNLFKEKIDEIYNIIFQPIDYMFKITAIENYKKQFGFGIEFSFGEAYLNLVENHKEQGIVYTPEKIADYMINNTVTEEDIINNPFLKIVDPACGCGNLIIPCIRHLSAIYNKNLPLINKKNRLNLKEENCIRHIIDNNIYGFDLDEFALKILSVDLFYEVGYVNYNNFNKKDFLLDEIDKRFNIVIGNPPYVGHKTVDKEYSLRLKSKYKNIFSDKGDISYCFFYSAVMNSEKEGKITFISSRYFLESPSGQKLRNFLKENTVILEIIDFYGVRPFKNKGIDPVIISFKNRTPEVEKFKVIKPIGNDSSFFENVIRKSGMAYEEFFVDRIQLEDERWILSSADEFKIIKKIEDLCRKNLSDICESNQGIISGCDNAFIVNSTIIESEHLEKDIIKPWIKSSYIEKNKVNITDNYIIYSDLIGSENEYPNIIKHISSFREKLQTRRECKTGVRKWFQLQWGRKPELFAGKKIIFPFKADTNKFAIDTGSFYSADIYSLLIKDDKYISYELLAQLLNSKVYEFYFKAFGKKLGNNAYEYYPSYIMKLKIPEPELLNTGSDEELYKLFGFNESEIKRIEKNY